MQSTTVEVPTELIGKVTTTVAATAKILGIGLNQCYASVKDGTIPSIRLQGRYVIPVAGLLEMLGISEPRNLWRTANLNAVARETGASQAQVTNGDPEQSRVASQADVAARGDVNNSDGDGRGAHPKIARR